MFRGPKQSRYFFVYLYIFKIILENRLKGENIEKPVPSFKWRHFPVDLKIRNSLLISNTLSIRFILFLDSSELSWRTCQRDMGFLLFIIVTVVIRWERGREDDWNWSEKTMGRVLFMGPLVGPSSSPGNSTTKTYWWWSKLHIILSSLMESG